MTMQNSRRFWLGVLAITIAGVLIAIVIQRQLHAQLRGKEEALRQQAEQVTELAAEHQRLTNRIALAKASSPDGQRADLERLRGEAEGLRKQTNTLGKQSERSRITRPPTKVTKPESHPPEYYQRLHQVAGGKDRDALAIGSALQQYAGEHNRQIPANMEQIAAYLRSGSQPLTGTNEFEIVYQGTLDRLQNVPLGSVALIRDRQIWRAPSGKSARVYGMANGAGLIVESDDDFQSWEAEHIIPPAAADR